MGMTGRGTGMATDTEICICIRIRGTPIRVPAGYTRTRVDHYLGLLDNSASYTPYMLMLLIYSLGCANCLKYL